jgi:hypothetical protein
MVIQEGCSAIGNKGAGFYAHGLGSVMQAGLDCRAYGNQQHGFCAYHGSCLKIEGGANASDNQCGFMSAGACSSLEAGPGCLAPNNKQHGMVAQQGGRLTVGSNSKATSNAWAGFSCHGEGSVIEVADGNGTTRRITAEMGPWEAAIIAVVLIAVALAVWLCQRVAGRMF